MFTMQLVTMRSIFILILLLSSYQSLSEEKKKVTSTKLQRLLSVLLSPENRDGNSTHLVPVATRGIAACLWLKKFTKQHKQCLQRRGFPEVLRTARNVATTNCQEQFQYDRWNCSIQPRTFRTVYRETALIAALYAAALLHTTAKACGNGKLYGCPCGTVKDRSKLPQPLAVTRQAATSTGEKFGSYQQGKMGGIGVNDVTESNNLYDQKWQWGGCGDNTRKAYRIVVNFLELKAAGENGKGRNVGKIVRRRANEVLNYDSRLGLRAVKDTEFDYCMCHGVSGSCIMRTCWKRLRPFSHIAEKLRSLYHKAECASSSSSDNTSRRNKTTNFSNTTTTTGVKRPSSAGKSKEYPQQRRSIVASNNSNLVYLVRSPNFCNLTVGRLCSDEGNCATLCCGRGFDRVELNVMARCNLRVIGCCDLKYDLCPKVKIVFRCK